MAVKTKNKLANSLIELLKTNNIDNLTISDIVEKCGVNRQTFYYHFKDMNDFLRWTFDTRIFTHSPNVNLDNWTEFMDSIIENVRENERFVYEAFHSKHRGSLEQHLYEYIYKFVYNVVDKSHHNSLNASEKDFYSRFYAYSLGGFILSWIIHNLKDDPSEFIKQVNKYVVSKIENSISD